jgi:hypothetical protein
MHQRFDDYEFPLSVGLCAPAVRLVVVEAWACLAQPAGVWETGSAIHPILAIQAEVRAEFSRPHRPNDHRRPTTLSPSEREGWIHESTGTHYDAIINTPEYGIAPASFACDGLNVACTVVECPWPKSQDAKRLAKVIAAVKAEAMTQAQAQAAEIGVSRTSCPN